MYDISLLLSCVLYIVSLVFFLHSVVAFHVAGEQAFATDNAQYIDEGLRLGSSLRLSGILIMVVYLLWIAFIIPTMIDLWRKEYGSAKRMFWTVFFFVIGIPAIAVYHFLIARRNPH